MAANESVFCLDQILWTSRYKIKTFNYIYNLVVPLPLSIRIKE